MSFELKDKEIGGFSLSGYVLKNGKIKILGSDRIINEWPEEIELNGSTFCFESKVDGPVNDLSEMLQDVEYC